MYYGIIINDMDRWGINLNPTIKRNIDLEQILRCAFACKNDELLLQATTDSSKRWNLEIPIGDIEQVFEYQGAFVNYCKKTKRFDFIQYTEKGYAKRFLL